MRSADGRTADELRAHYEVEKELAARLRGAGRDERLELYGRLYDELLARVPLHPQLTRKADPASYAWAAERQLRALRPYLAPSTTFLEVGAGDCAVSRAVAPHVRRVYAVDVSAEIAGGLHLPPNVEVRLTDGLEIPVEPGSIGVAYSNQLLEHLHPDDAAEQVRNVHEALEPGGVYVAVTPNRLSGPHDVSKHFDDVPTGFHLREYSVGELRRLFAEAGFSSVHVRVGGRGRLVSVPTGPVEAIEALLDRASPALRRRVAGTAPMRAILGIRIVGRK